MARRANPGIQAVGPGKAATGERKRVPCRRRGGTGQSVHGGGDSYRLSRGAGRGGLDFTSRPWPRTKGAAARTEHALAPAANDAPFSADALFAAGGLAQRGNTRNIERGHTRRIDKTPVERAAATASINIARTARASAGVERRTSVKSVDFEMSVIIRNLGVEV